MDFATDIDGAVVKLDAFLTEMEWDFVKRYVLLWVIRLSRVSIGLHHF